MNNQLNKSGAELQFAMAPNQVYATIIAALAACNFGVATDHKAWVFADHEGNTFKTLQDSSGDGIIAENSIITADADGRATSNTDFTYDGSTMQFPLNTTLAFGDQTANGSWRILIATGGISAEKREAGVWNEKWAIF